MIDSDQTPKPSEHRSHLLTTSVADVLGFASSLSDEDVILIVDARDDFGADLAACAYMPSGTMSQAEADAHYTEAAAQVGRFAEEQAGSGRVPTITAVVSRDAMVGALHGVDLAPQARLLEAEPDLRVMVVAAGGVLLSPLPAAPTGVQE